ncbi:MAG: hypothetical protein P4L36_06415 [Holophaga sp.]|nr:hypothetical protein [Holophaga sp.]
MAPGRGPLAHAGMGRVRYAAEGAEPWTRVRVRATSLDDPAAHAEAVLEVLPSEVFGVLEQVLGRVTARNLDNPAYAAEAQVVVPALISHQLHPVDLGFGVVMIP